jgi:hypothetical protein
VSPGTGDPVGVSQLLRTYAVWGHCLAAVAVSSGYTHGSCKRHGTCSGYQIARRAGRGRFDREQVGVAADDVRCPNLSFGVVG